MIIDTFKELAQYHLFNQFDKCKKHHIKNGTLRDSYGNPLKIGSDSGTPQSGIMILQNGTTLIKKLLSDYKTSNAFIHEPIELYSESDFKKYLQTQEEEDGVLVLERTPDQNNLVRIARINNSPLELDLKKLLPKDFINPNSEDYVKIRNLGTKTLLGLEITQLYDNVTAYQIKRSAGITGFGKVTEFDKTGLRRELYISDISDKVLFSDISDKLIPTATLNFYPTQDKQNRQTYVIKDLNDLDKILQETNIDSNYAKKNNTPIMPTYPGRIVA